MLSEPFVELVGKLAEGEANDKQTTERSEGVSWNWYFLLLAVCVRAGKHNRQRGSWACNTLQNSPLYFLFDSIFEKL